MALERTATRVRILDTAQRLIQLRGFSAFSFADIAADVGIRTASIHHHFPTKADLAVALMERYRAEFAAALATIETRHATITTRLDAYQKLFSNVLRDDHRLCMCGMLAADFDALPTDVRFEVRAFFDDNERWLTKVIAEGMRGGRMPRGSATARARVLLSSLEGAMLVARTYRDVARFTAVARRVVADAVRE